MCRVNFVEEFNLFMRKAYEEGYTLHERALWTALFAVANDRAVYDPESQIWQWPDRFMSISNGIVTMNSGLDKRSIEKARESLQGRGLIDFIPGSGKKCSPQYRLNYLSTARDNCPLAKDASPQASSGDQDTPGLIPDPVPCDAPGPVPDRVSDPVSDKRLSSNIININKKSASEKKEKHTQPDNGHDRTRAREAMKPDAGKEDNIAWDSAWKTSARVRAAVVQRILDHFEGDMDSGNAHDILCDMMSLGLSPEEIESAAAVSSGLQQLCAKARVRFVQLGLDKEKERRERSRYLLAAGGNQRLADWMYDHNAACAGQDTAHTS